VIPPRCTARHRDGIFTGAIEASSIASAFDRRIRIEGNVLHAFCPTAAARDDQPLQLQAHRSDRDRQGSQPHA